MRTSSQLRRHWRTLHPAVLAVPVLATLASSAWAADKYWDINGTAAGAGGATPSGTWNATLSNFNTDPTGGNAGALSAWTSNTDNAFFSADSDATGAYTVTTSAALTANSVTVKNGTVTFAATGAITATNGFNITNGATMKIASAANVAGGTGAKVTLDAGRLMQTNPGNAGSFVPAALGLQIGASGSGTVDYTSSGSGTVSLYAGTITGVGGTVSNGGFGTLYKTGPNEFRYQGTGLPNTTFSKLVVQQGLFRLGFASSTSSELGFGAAPLAPTADAITLDGGAIGTSFGVTTNANRGIYLTSNGGAINATAASFTSGGAITGTGILTTTGTVRINAVSNFGGLTANGPVTIAKDTTVGKLAGSGTVTINSATKLTAGDATDMSFGGTLAGSGNFVKAGSGKLALTSANTYSGTTDIQQGTLLANNGATGNATGSDGVTVENGAKLSTSTGGAVGAVNVLPGGTITAEPLQVLVVNGDATIAGTSSGNINYKGNVVVSATGTLSPGNSPGTQSVTGDLTLQGVTLMEIGGTAAGQFDQIIVGGTMHYGGELDVQLLGPYTPKAGDFFSFFDVFAEVDTFDKIVLPSLPSGLRWDTSALYSDGVLGVTVPMPSAAWMGVVLLSGLVARRTRAR